MLMSKCLVGYNDMGAADRNVVGGATSTIRKIAGVCTYSHDLHVSNKTYKIDPM